MGTGSYLGVKRPRRGVDSPLLSSAEDEERIELRLYSPSWPPGVEVTFFVKKH